MTHVYLRLVGLFVFGGAMALWSCGGKAGPPEGKLSLERLDQLFAEAGFEVLKQDEYTRKFRLIVDAKRQIIARAKTDPDHAVSAVRIFYRVQAPVADTMFDYWKREHSAVSPVMDSEGVSLSIEEFDADGLGSYAAGVIENKLGWIKSAAQDLDRYVIDFDKPAEKLEGMKISLNGGR